MNERRTPSTGTTTSISAPRLNWRTVDMITAAVLGVACGPIFLVWNQIGGLGYSALDALAPEIGGLVLGIWLPGGTLGGLIIRKPRAAILVETIAASVSAALDSQWGIGTLYLGIVQGLGVELILLILMYRRYNTSIAALSGLGARVAAWVLELFTAGSLAMRLAFLIAYLICCILSDLVLDGLVVWLLVKTLAATGALDRFAAERGAHARV